MSSPGCVPPFRPVKYPDNALLDSSRTMIATNPIVKKMGHEIVSPRYAVLGRDQIFFGSCAGFIRFRLRVASARLITSLKPKPVMNADAPTVVRETKVLTLGEARPPSPPR